MQRISGIAACSINWAIGNQGALPWKLPDDLANFRLVTRGAPFIMGRKSFESPDALLSDVQNIIITHQTSLDIGPNDQLADSPEAALEICKESDEVFVLGGEIIFQQLLPHCNYLYLTVVHAHAAGDAFFPALDWRDWALVQSVHHRKDEAHTYAFDLNQYRRISG